METVFIIFSPPGIIILYSLAKIKCFGKDFQTVHEMGVKTPLQFQAVFIQKKIEQTDYEVALFIMVRDDRVFDKNNLFE